MILSESHEIGIPNVELVSDGENWYVVNGSGNIKEYSLLLDKPLPIWLDASELSGSDQGSADIST